MKQWSLIKILIPWFVLLTVASCNTYDLAGGGIGGTGATNDLAGGGIGGTGISIGKITAFGSVWVNGVEYSTTGAIIAIEGIESISDGSVDYDSNLLDEGKIVTIHWTKDTTGIPFAERIEFDDNLEGAVTSINPAAQTIEVLGQAVKIDVSTVFENSIDDVKIVGNIDTILGAIGSGNIVEVSGFVDASGTIHATYIELKSSEFTPGVTEVEVKGVITNLDSPIVGTFTIGILTIGYDSDTELPSGGLSNDLYVEVKGTLDYSGLVLSATKIEEDDDLFEKNSGKRIEIEGIVTSLVGVNGQFDLNGRSVRIITGTTQFENNATAEDILPGVKIEVEGTVDEYGVLIAEKIEIESGDDGSGEDSGNNDPGTNDSDSVTDEESDGDTGSGDD